MNGCIEQYENVCKGEFASVHTKLDRMDEAIRGNALGEKLGIQVRLDRLEQDAKRQSKLVWMLLGACLTALTSAVATWLGA